MFNLKMAIVFLVTLLAFAAVYQYQKMKTMRLIVSSAETRISALERGLSVLKSQDEKNRKSIERLLIQQDQISQHQVEQQNAFTRLQNEYATVKDWSNVLLPTELTSLLNRPARIGYRSNDSTVRTGNSLPAAGSTTSKDR